MCTNLVHIGVNIINNTHTINIYIYEHIKSLNRGITYNITLLEMCAMLSFEIVK